MTTLDRQQQDAPLDYAQVCYASVSFRAITEARNYAATLEYPYFHWQGTIVRTADLAEVAVLPQVES